MSIEWCGVVVLSIHFLPQFLASHRTKIVVKMNSMIKEKLSLAVDMAKEFSKIYYESVDRKRHQLVRLYAECGSLVWNGNGVLGNQNIQNFLMNLPSCDHNIQCLDAQPFLNDNSREPTTVMIQTAGTVRFKDSQVRSFQQTFVLSAFEGKWKIVTDCYRIQDALAEAKWLNRI